MDSKASMASSKTVLILGGYGNTGRLLAKHLLNEASDVKVIIAGRNLDRAKELVDILGPRAIARSCDASKSNLVESLRDVDLLVVASNTLDHVDNVVKAALDARVDYFDILLSNKNKLKCLESRKKEIQDAELCFVTDGGSHPGLPAAAIRYAACMSSDDIVSAKIFVNISMDFKRIEGSDALYEEFLSEVCTMQMRVYDGDEPRWRDVSWMAPPVPFDFGPPFGMKNCFPMFLQELNEVTEMLPSIQELGLYMAGFNWFTDFVILPLALIAIALFGKLVLRPMSKMFVFSLDHFSKPPYETSFSLVTRYRQNAQEDSTKEGSIHSSRLTLSHVDGYELTAIPAVACLLQMLDGRRSGVFLQATFVEPTRFFDDMKRMGVQIITVDETNT